MMDKLDSNIVFDRLYMDLSHETREKLSPIQLSDYEEELPSRKKEILSALDQKIEDSERELATLNANLRDYWRAVAQGKEFAMRDGYASGVDAGYFSNFIQRRNFLADYIPFLHSQHDWLTGTEMSN